MPYSCALDQPPVEIETIDDPVGPMDDLADSGIAIFRNHTTCLGVLLQNVSPPHQFVSEGSCALRIVARDKANNVAQVVPAGSPQS